MSDPGAVRRSLPLTDLDDDEQAFREVVRDFAEAKVRPLVSKMDEDASIPRDLIDACFELGIMGIEIPEKYSGAGATFFMAILVVEELARVDASVAVLVDVQNTLVNNALLRWGTEEQKARYFPNLATRWVGAYALSEAGSGSDAFALSCRAVDKGDHYELTGRKLWITNAGEADLFVVMATVDPSKGYKGITSFLVERSFAGFTVGKKENKLGIRASSTCELVFEGCRVPRENVLGEVGKGYKIAIETLNEGRIGIGAQMVGVAQGSFEHGLSYARERQQFGKPIVEFQAIQFQLADLATEIEAARLLTYNAARLRDVGAPFVKEAAMAKLFASRMAEQVTSKVIEVYGGYGFSREYPVEKFFRDQKVGQIYEGTSNMQLLIIAKQLLGKMLTTLLSLSAAELLDRFASPDPTPGGGSAAALGGALGAALVSMVCAMPKTRTGAAPERSRLDAALAWAREAGERLRALVEEDTRAYDAVVAAYRLAKGTDEEKAARKAAIAVAIARATEVPLETAEACLVVLKSAEEAVSHGNPNALSDARAGAALGFAGLMGAAENVRINAASLPEEGIAATFRVEAAVEEGRRRAAALGLPSAATPAAGQR